MTKEFITLGGIKYLVRIKYDSFWVLTLPFGKVEYKVPVNPNKSSNESGKFEGLPVTFGRYYQDKKIKNYDNN